LISEHLSCHNQMDAMRHVNAFGEDWLPELIFCFSGESCLAKVWVCYNYYVTYQQFVFSQTTMGWLLIYDDWLSQPRIRHTFYGAIIGISLSYTTFSFTRYLKLRRQRRQVEIFEARPIELRSDEIVSGATGLIGMCIIMIQLFWNMTWRREHSFG